MEDKLTEIEITIAHQESRIDELSDIVHKQWLQIDLLNKKLIFANNKLNEIESFIDDKANDDGAMGANLEQDRPPHY